MCITVDKLEVIGNASTFQRFDKFNAKYSPMRSEKLRTVFLKTDNHLKGRFFAELTQKCTARLADDGHTFAECVRYARVIWQLHSAICVCTCHGADSPARRFVRHAWFSMCSGASSIT